MDVLEFKFDSRPLKNLQQEIFDLVNLKNSMLIMGDVGSGKTTWAHALTRAEGVAFVLESHEAPKNLKSWKDLAILFEKQPVIFENVDKWTEATQCSYIQFIKEQKPQFKKLVATASSRFTGKVREGHFKSDVYYALSVRKVELPKLAECSDDFEKIILFWIDVHSLMQGLQKVRIQPDAIDKLKSHKWMGNFSELINVLERALTFSKGDISAEHISFEDWEHDYTDLEAGLTLAEVERKLIMQTLNLTAQNKSQAARMLGISIRTLRNKLNEYRQEVSHEFI